MVFMSSRFGSLGRVNNLHLDILQVHGRRRSGRGEQKCRERSYSSYHTSDGGEEAKDGLRAVE